MLEFILKRNCVWLATMCPVGPVVPLDGVYDVIYHLSNDNQRFEWTNSACADWASTASHDGGMWRDAASNWLWITGACAETYSEIEGINYNCIFVLFFLMFKFPFSWNFNFSFWKFLLSNVSHRHRPVAAALRFSRNFNWFSPLVSMITFFEFFYDNSFVKFIRTRGSQRGVLSVRCLRALNEIHLKFNF